MVCSTCSKRSIRLATSQDATKKKRKTWCPSGEDCLQSFLVFAQVYKRLFSVSELNYFVKFPFISIAIRSMFKCIESTDSYLSGEGYLDIFREISSNQSSLVVKVGYPRPPEPVSLPGSYRLYSPSVLTDVKTFKHSNKQHWWLREWILTKMQFLFTCIACTGPGWSRAHTNRSSESICANGPKGKSAGVQSSKQHHCCVRQHAFAGW